MINVVLEDDKCHVRSTCINTQGSYMCQFKEGWTGDGRHCSAETGLHNIMGIASAAASGALLLVIVVVIIIQTKLATQHVQNGVLQCCIFSECGSCTRNSFVM